MLGLGKEETSFHDMMLGLAGLYDINRVDPSSYVDLRKGFKSALEIPNNISDGPEQAWEKLDALCQEKLQKTFTDLIEESLTNQKIELNFINRLTTA